MLCFKCSGAPAVVASREGRSKSLCAACHVDFVIRNSRDALFRESFVPVDTFVAIGVSGGVNSMALAHLLGVLRQQNLQRGGNGKIVFDFHLVHIDESELLLSADSPAAVGQWSLLETAALQWQYNGQALYSKDRIHAFTVRELLSTKHAADSPSPFQTALDVLNESRMSLTDRAVFFERLKARLLVLAVRLVMTKRFCGDGSEKTEHASPPHLVLGDNALRGASRALYTVVLGDGAHLPELSGYRSSTPGAVLLRPLAGLLPKEILYYARLSGVVSVPPPSRLLFSTAVLPVRGASRRTVQGLIEDFLASLMIGFRSTVFNVLHTVSKISATVGPAAAAGATGDKAGRGRFVLSRDLLAAQTANVMATEREKLQNLIFCFTCGLSNRALPSPLANSLCHSCQLLHDSIGAISRRDGRNYSVDVSSLMHLLL
jgi:tRNA(Ile)-lysidine synthase TilS/MesJ